LKLHHWAGVARQYNLTLDSGQRAVTYAVNQSINQSLFQAHGP